jgi:hypothetical protein
MTPEDAANLLLAVMYDGELAVAEQSTRSLFAAKRSKCRHRRFGEAEDRLGDHPRNGFLGGETESLSFGEVLTTILDWFVRYGTLDEGDDTDVDLDAVNLRITVSSPGYEAMVHFNTHEGFWDLTYEWISPEQLSYGAEHKGDLLVTRWDALNGPYMWSSRTVADDSLHKIADCLRGCELNTEQREVETA